MTPFQRRVIALHALLIGLAFPSPGATQTIPEGEGVRVARGTSTVLTSSVPIQRLSLGDPSVADAVPVSPREILITGTSPGTTSLIVWDTAEGRTSHQIEVVVDVAALERQVSTLFPGEQLRLTASGNVVVVAGEASSRDVAQQALDLVRATGATVIDAIGVQAPAQVMLQVRFAEISRSASGVFDIQGAIGGDALRGPLRELDWLIENTLGQITRVSVLQNAALLDIALNALQSQGLLQVLAEPNLLALDGEPASFLAGGEFPFPVVQGGTGATGGAFTVQFREFGIRLRFVPTITTLGNIRLNVAPEVSQLDFGNSVLISGFAVPALRTRRAETSVELRPGQTLAIAGLMDHSLARTVEKVPVLGDVPILGALFRSSSYRQNRSELIVLVTPVLVEPTNAPPPLPTGEPEQWRWDPSLIDPAGAGEPSSSRGRR